MNSIRILLADDARLQEVETIALQHGWPLCSAKPQHYSQRFNRVWAVGESWFGWFEDGHLGVRYLEHDTAWELPEALAEMTTWKLDKAIERAEEAKPGSPERLEGLLRSMALVRDVFPPALTELLRESVTSTEIAEVNLVKEACYRCTTMEWVEEVRKFAELASDEHAEEFERIANLLQSNAEGNFADDVTAVSSVAVLDRMALKAREEGQWGRLAAISERAMELPYNDFDTTAWTNLAIANDRLKRPWSAHIAAMVATALHGDDDSMEPWITPILERSNELDPSDLTTDHLDCLNSDPRSVRDVILTVIDALIELYGHGPLEAELAWRRGIIAAEAGRDDALIWLERTRNLGPDSRPVLDMLYRISNPEKANILRDQLIELIETGDDSPWSQRATQILEATTSFQLRSLVSLLIRKGSARMEAGAPYEELLDISRRAVAADPDDGVARLNYAMQLTNLYRHAEAVEAYTAAIEVIEASGTSHSEEDIAWFNRACERAITGDREGALQDLAVAIRKNEEYREEAAEDDYFDSLRDDERFQALLRGDTPVVEEPEPSYRSKVDKLLQRVENVLSPLEHPKLAREWQAWAAIRDALGGLVDLGWSDAEIGELLLGALRGQSPPPKVAQMHPVARALADFADRASQRETIVTSAMAVDLLAAGKCPLGETLDDLTTIALGAVKENLAAR